MKQLKRRDNPWRTVHRPTVFLMPSGADRSVCWLVCNRSGPGSVTREENREDLAGSLLPLIQRQGDALDCMVILPAETVLHTRVTVPRPQRRYLHQSLPYVVEAQLAFPVESQHVVAGSPLAGDDMQALVVSCTVMDWVAALPDRIPGLRLAGVYSESQVLSAGAARDEYRCLWDGDRMLVSAPGSGFVTDRSDLGLWLSRGAGSQPGTGSIHPICHDQSDDSVATLVAELETQSVQVAEPRRLDTDALEFWARRVLQRPAEMVDLLTGRYSRDGEGARIGRFATALAAAAMMLMSGLTVWQVGALERAEAMRDATENAIATLYRQSVPSSLSDYQPDRWRRTVETALVPGRADAPRSPELLSILMRLNAGLSGQTVRLEEIRYSEATGLMQLVVLADGTAELDRLRASLEQASLEVTYSASQTGNRFRGDYRVVIPGGGT